MTGTAKAALVCALLACSPGFGQDWATKMFATTSHDFGLLARGSKAEFRFGFQNIYVEDVHVSDVQVSCGCTVAQVAKPDLKTYEQGAIVASINTLAFLGKRGATVTITFDRPFYAQVQVQTSCYIRQDVVFDPGSVQFGSVDQGIKAERSVAVRYAGRNDWRIVDVRSANPHLSGKVAQTRRGDGLVDYNLVARLDASAPPGYLNEHLILVTDDNQQTQVPIHVEGRIEPAVSVSPPSLFFGMVQPGQKVARQLVVRGKTPFRILSIACDGKGVEFDTSGAKGPKTLHLIPVTYVARGDAGNVTYTIRIVTDLTQPVPPLSAYAVVTP